ncbi:hypothetical protein Peur_006990 [Populus x canadensis]
MLFQNLDLVNFDQRITYDLVSKKNAEEAFQLTEIELGLNIILKEWDLFAVDFDALSDAVEVKHHPLYSGGGTEVIGSVNGLVFLRRSETNIAVYNLSTRECKKCYVAETEIPRRDMTTGYVYYGFGYDSYGDDYKVVRMAQFVREDGGGNGGGWGCEYEVKVYSLKNDKWKKIEGLPIRLRLLSKPFFHILNRRGYGVFAGHALHWIVPQRRQLGIRDCVLGFDIRDDKFFELPQSDYENKGMNFQVDVGVLEGNLCVMCNYEHVCVDVWVMKEYGVKESWCKMFSVHAIKWISAFMFLRPLVYSKGGDMVLLEVNGEKLLWINDGDRIGWKKQQGLDEEEEEMKTDRNKSCKTNREKGYRTMAKMEEGFRGLIAASIFSDLLAPFILYPQG